MNESITIELSSRFDGWWRYNVELLCELRDAEGRRIGVASKSDDIAEVGAGLKSKPAGTESFRKTELRTGPCAGIRLFIYVIPHSLLPDRGVEGGRDFKADLTVRCGDRALLREALDINQWGGLSAERTVNGE